MRQEEDISPWRQTEHDEHAQPRAEGGTPGKHAKYLQLGFQAGEGLQGRGKRPALEPVLMSPPLRRSKSIREVSLPKLPSRVEETLERRGSFRSGHLIPLAKPPRASVEEGFLRTGRVSQPSQQLRAKLDSLLRQQQISVPVAFSRNLSEVVKSEQLLRENNIVFVYPHDPVQRPQESPRKKPAQHVLDRLLGDWK